jgi:hypothetical protein
VMFEIEQALERQTQANRHDQSSPPICGGELERGGSQPPG